MAMRVATFASSQSLLQAAMRIQVKQAEATEQQASGQVSGDYGGLGSKAGSVVSLQASITRSKAYEEAGNTASSRVETMYNAVGSILDDLSSLKATLASSTISSDTLQATAQSTLESVVSLMNTQLDGRYLFAGSAIDTEPVDIDSIEGSTATSQDELDYYQGDDQQTSVQVSSSRSISYGVTANDDSFRQALWAISTIANGSTDSTSVTNAIDLLASSISSMANVQTKLSLASSDLKSAVSSQEDYQTNTADVISNLSEVDITTVAANMSNYEAQLEAAYAAIGKIANLSLASYLS
jgi:flagellar hook-associated protein 3 FlgL